MSSSAQQGPAWTNPRATVRPQPAPVKQIPPKKIAVRTIGTVDDVQLPLLPVAPPLSCTEWRDPMSSAVGWLVVDRRVNGISGGGTFLWHGATAEETRGIARTMSKKFAICPKPIGGAKAGIRCDLKDPVERRAVLRRFLQSMRSELKERWVTAGDFGTSDAFIDQTIRELTGNSMQWALYRQTAGDEAKALRLSARAPDLYRVNMSEALLDADARRPEFEMPFVEAAVGFGIVQSTLAAYTKLEPHRVGLEKPLEGVRIAVAGAGAVGTGVMLYASRLGAQIIAVSDGEGLLFDSRGLDVERMLRLRARFVSRLPEEQRLHAGKLLFKYVANSCYAPERLVTRASLEAESPELSRFVEPLLSHMLRNAEAANVFVPAASRYHWNVMAAEMATQGLWKCAAPRLLVAGANNVFGAPGDDGNGVGLPPAEADSTEILKRMCEQGVVHVPDFRANGGTAQLFHCHAAGELDWILDGAPTGVPVLSREDQNLALHATSHRIRKAVLEDLDLCDPDCLDLPHRAEIRVAKQLADL